ncbi:Hypothetical predicted protein [Cloeon dipterum]|uniref:Small subunit processome component 20 homolog n=1 Tax=Cloeon dipterum TaxID=197152 RepID=A0A8S1D340_9INSE|nr:Hypothetical predicted protein [Cloeon dipterum]
MKNKPTRHKETNAFRFQSFSERIASLQIDVYHKIHAYDPDAEEGETNLQNAIEKWTVQNATEGFEKCCRALPDCKNLELIVLYKDKIAGILFEHIRKHDPATLQALLELLVALGRDLAGDFFPFFPECLSVIFDLITSSRDPEVLEWTFHTLAYLLKFVWKRLSKEPASVIFKFVLPLLEDSRPVYIREFAAQCFAFVARKVRVKKDLITVMVQTLDKQDDGVEGSGILICETLYGVSGCFHSTAEDFLDELLSSLAREDINCDILKRVVMGAVQRLIQKVKRDNFGLFWTQTSSVAEKFTSESHFDALTKLLDIVRVVCKTKGGSFVQTPAVVSLLNRLTAVSQAPQHTLQALAKVVAKVLCAPALRLTQEETATLASKTLLIEDKHILLGFVGNVISCTCFEAYVLQKLIKFCKEKAVPEDFPTLVLLLAKIIEVKAPPCHSGLEISSWKQYPLALTKGPLTEFILEQLQSEKIDSVVPAVMLLPHLYCVDRSAMKAKLLHLIKQSREQVFIMGLAVEAAVHLMLVDELDQELIVSVALEHSEQLAALRMLDIFVTAKNNRDKKLFDHLMQANFHHLLSSPHHKNRVLASHTLSMLEPKECKLFSMCLNTENTPATITDYRDRVKGMQGLEFKYVHSMSAYSNEVALRYLIGNLYVNFKLLWEPATSVIVSHANCQDSHAFWSVFGEQIKLARDRCVNPKTRKADLGDCNEFVKSFHDNLEGQLDTPDHANFRCLLWSAMTFFSDVCEARNHDISILFLEFLQTEFYKNDVSDVNFWNVIKDKNEQVPMETEEPVEEDEDEDEEKEELAAKSKNRPAMRLLLAHLMLLSKLRNPRGMYREPELNDAYHELLKMRNPKAQQLALNCIMGYKHAYLTPYKDQLYGLANEKDFKQQLVAFDVGAETETVLAEHRVDLIPVVMRIVLSKMQKKGGSNKALILRFLGGCRQEELSVFIHLAFKHVLALCPGEDEPLDAMVRRVMSSVDLSRVSPPKRLCAAINLANVVRAQLGRDHTLSGALLLRVQLLLAAQVAGVLARREEVARTAATAFRAARKHAIDSLCKLFLRDYHGDASTVHQWSSAEVDAVFETVVWPSVDVLHLESLIKPTALLRLFSVWAGNTRYFNLLVKHRPGNRTSYPLAAMLKLLNAEGVKSQVVVTVLDALTNLLTLRPATEEEEEELDAGTAAHELTDVSDLLPVDLEYLSKIQTPGLQLNYGSQLLFPHVPELLAYLHRRVDLASTKMKAKGGLSERDLVILARVSELVFDPEPSLSLLRLVLPLAAKKASLGSGDKNLEPLLSTTASLLRRIENPRQFVLQIAPLFSSVNGRSSRDRLCQMVFSRVINLIDEAEAKVVCDLNAWDPRLIEEPDFEKRISAFSKVKEMDGCSIEFFLMIIHSSFHTLKAEKDRSLKDCASLCLQILCPKLAKRFADQPELRSLVMERTVMEIIRRGVRSKNEDLQQEVLGLLGVMVRECPELHPTLKDLQPLAQPDDLELDFFENIRHLQMHRRGRALMRFATAVKENGVVMKTTTLTQIILPLATSFLCVEQYAKNNSLVDAAIEAVAAVCALLPWAEYEAVMRYHLTRLPRMLDYQKQLVRTVIAVLDAFHFDLSILESKKIAPMMMSWLSCSSRWATRRKMGDKKEEIKKCDLSQATKIRNVILGQLLPKLQHAISAKSATDNQHKVIKQSETFAEEREREGREVLRVPIALAIVKLLQKLPGNDLRDKLTGVLMKVCVFLRSKLESTRRAARETLLQMLHTLGTGFLAKMLDEMFALLTRGYLVHVLVYTVHSLIVGVKDIIKPGDLDPCLKQILQVCVNDIFGEASEEKEVAQIAGKTSEARSHKSFDTLHLVAKYASEGCITDILIPIKNVLATSLNHKVLTKAKSCLQQIVQGLADNAYISPESLLTFAYGTANESIPALQSSMAKAKPPVELTPRQKAYQRPDIFLIDPPTQRSRPVVPKSDDTHAHMFIGFGLQLLHFLLKRERTKELPDERLDPFIRVLVQSLESKHVKLTVLSLQCLAWLLKLPLPSLKENVVTITESIFGILHKYSGCDQSAGELFEMVNGAFKAVSVVVREVEYHDISKEQIRGLLLYVERDIQADSSRQATAFTLLKAILRRRLSSPDLPQIMLTVATTMVTSTIENVRHHCRQAYLMYMTSYLTAKKFKSELTFLLDQLEYELMCGRMSTLDTLSALVNGVQPQRLNENCLQMFISLSLVLVDDDEPDCRRAAAKVIRAMIEKISKKNLELLYSCVMDWLEDKLVFNKRMAAQLCGIFVNLEGEKFQKRLPKLLPLLYECLFPNSKTGRFVRAPPSAPTEEEKGVGTMEDHLAYQTLVLLDKLSTFCPIWTKDPQVADTVSDLCLDLARLLGHPHEWVRLGACQVLGNMFSEIDPAAVAQAVAAGREECPELLVFRLNPEFALKTLVLDHCDLLQPGDMQPQLIEEVVKNLVYLFRVLRHIPTEHAISLDEEQQLLAEGEEEARRKPKLSTVWMARRMRKIVNLEVSKAPKSGTLRTAVLKWVAALVIDMGGEALTKNPLLMHHMLAPVVREISITNENNPHAPVGLRRLAKEVAHIIKEQIGVEAFAMASTRLNAKFNEHKVNRKRKIVQQAITEPELAAKRRIKKQVKKKELKKKNLNKFKGRVRKDHRLQAEDDMEF